jgi:hypothetical protein
MCRCETARNLVAGYTNRLHAKLTPAGDCSDVLEKKMTDETSVTRPDLDALIGRVYYAADWAFSSAPGDLQEALWEAGAAIESERSRADEAERALADAPHEKGCGMTLLPGYLHAGECFCWKSTIASSTP